MPIATPYTFTTDPTRKPANLHADAPKTPEPYIAGDDLIQAVNLAIFLHRPLLLEGEAGCGKSMLARAVAYDLGLPFYRWDVRSTSKAQEGLYTYDAVLRLHDVQTAKLDADRPVAADRPRRDPSDPTHYRSFGALGKAFALTTCPAVVLIDEIDKADVDFPNDLLGVLDEPWRFTIHETGETITATHYPIIIVTSNKEKGNCPPPSCAAVSTISSSFPPSRNNCSASWRFTTASRRRLPRRWWRQPARAFWRCASRDGCTNRPAPASFWTGSPRCTALARARRWPRKTWPTRRDRCPFPNCSTSCASTGRATRSRVVHDDLRQ
jgi:hypothetical protein